MRRTVVTRRVPSHCPDVSSGLGVWDWLGSLIADRAASRRASEMATDRDRVHDPLASLPSLCSADVVANRAGRSAVCVPRRRRGPFGAGCAAGLPSPPTLRHTRRPRLARRARAMGYPCFFLGHARGGPVDRRCAPRGQCPLAAASSSSCGHSGPGAHGQLREQASRVSARDARLAGAGCS